MQVPHEEPFSGPASADDLIGALLRHFSGDPSGEGAEPALVRQIRAELEGNGLLRDDMLRLWRMLHACLAGVSRPAPDPSAGPVRILNLACAHCEEAPVLGAFFGRGAPVRFYGMDVRAREIDRAGRRYEVTEKLFRKFTTPALRGEKSEFEFIADDATRLRGYRELPDAFDVIFMRHQNVWNDRKVWQRIFAFALDRLADEGVLVITSYFDREHLIALETFQSLGAEVLASLRNPQSRELDYPGKSVDRHVAALIRRRPESAPTSLILP